MPMHAYLFYLLSSQTEISKIALYIHGEGAEAQVSSGGVSKYRIKTATKVNMCII